VTESQQQATEPCTVEHAALAHLRLTYEVRVFLCIFDSEVCELDIEVLVDRMKHTTQLQFVLQFDDHFLTHQRLEKLKEMLEGGKQQPATKNAANKATGKVSLLAGRMPRAVEDGSKTARLQKQHALQRNEAPSSEP
jgi:hypothetical protein